MTNPSRRHHWVPIAGALAGTAFVVKYAMMMSAGDGLPDSAYAVLWFSAVVLGSAAGIGLGLRRTVTWQVVTVAIAAPVVWLAWIMGLGEILEPVARQLGHSPDEATEFPLGVAGVVMLAAAYVGYRHDQEWSSPREPARVA